MTCANAVRSGPVANSLRPALASLVAEAYGYHYI